MVKQGGYEHDAGIALIVFPYKAPPREIIESYLDAVWEEMKRNLSNFVSKLPDYFLAKKSLTSRREEIVSRHEFYRSYFPLICQVQGKEKYDVRWYFCSIT